MLSANTVCNAITIHVINAIVMQWFNDDFDKIEVKQFGCVAETSTTDALVEMLHRWYKATYVCGTYIRIILYD